MIKRQKVQAPERVGSRLYSPFRTLGVVCDHVPCSVTPLGQSFVVATSVGRSFQLFDASNLNLLFVSQPPCPRPIRSLKAHFKHVFVAYGSTIAVYLRAREVCRMDLNDSSAIINIEVFGQYVCVSTQEIVYILKFNEKENTLERYTELNPPKVLGNIVGLVHPPTYLNKIIIATSSCLVLYNVKTGKMIHTYDEIPEGISSLELCPTALDIVAVITPGGNIILEDIRLAKIVLRLSVGKPVSSLSFRTDGVPFLGVGTDDGDVFFYNLDKGRRVFSMRELHSQKKVSAVTFLANQPVAVTSGADNQLIELVFDPPSSGVSPPPRILRRRGGHAQPPTVMSFTDEESHFILSASVDRSLWAFSLRKDSQSYRFSSSKVGELPPINDLAYQADKQAEWDNILTAHKGEKFARSWSGRRGILGSNMMSTADDSFVKCVSISSCGNFGLVGSAGGSTAVYNMQSGRLYKRFPFLHQAALSAIAINAVNTILVTTGLDGFVRFTDFRNGKTLDAVDLKSPVTNLKLHRGLLAVTTDDLAVFVLDLATRKVVREFWGHGNRVTSLDFSRDSRWVVSAGLDNTIRTWDIPSGLCIDAIEVPEPVTCLRLSPDGYWLATSHVNITGINLWAIKSGIVTHKVTSIKHVDMPSVAGRHLDYGATATDDVDIDELEVDTKWKASDQLASGLVTFSGQPRAKFGAIVNIDVFHERNKPVKPVEKPKHAPFFLNGPSTNEDTTMSRPDGSDELIAPDSGHSHLIGEAKKSLISQSLDNPQELVKELAKLGPAAIDVELRLVQPAELPQLLNAFASELEKGRYFELIQAWVKTILRVHSESLRPEDLDMWQKSELSVTNRVQQELQYCLGVVSYLRTL